MDFLILTSNPFFQIAALVVFLLILTFTSSAMLAYLRTSLSKRQQIGLLTCLSAAYKPLIYLTWLAALIYIANILSTKVFTLPPLNMSLILSVGATLAFGWFLLRWNHQMGSHMREKSQQQKIALTIGQLDLISKLTTATIIFVMLFLLMEVTGQSLQTLIAFGGIGGLALAFASQHVISNFFGGLMVYTTQPFTIGEFISLPDNKIEGQVEQIGWYMTEIRNVEKKPIYVPNSIFTQTVLVNRSRQNHERFYQALSLRYEDISVVKEVVEEIKKMLIEHPHVDRQLKVDAFLAGFNSTPALDITLSAYILVAGQDFAAIRQDLLLKTAAILTKQGAALATPYHLNC